MPNNQLQPYAADRMAAIYRRRGQAPFPKIEMPPDVRPAVLRANNIVKAAGPGQYQLTPKAVEIMRRRKLI